MKQHAIVPLLQHLMQDKPMQQGLFVYGHIASNRVLAFEHALATMQMHWNSCSLEEMAHYPFTQRVDLAWVQVDIDKVLPEEVLTFALTRLRDLLARHVCLMITYKNDDQNECQQHYTQLLRALGFSALLLPEAISQALGVDAQSECWQFNILAYKQVPDWLNAKYWANPENWDKYRW